MDGPLKRAIDIVGSQSALARAIGITPQAVQYWAKKGVRVPAEYCAGVETATGGQVTRAELRPDLFDERAA